MRKLFYTILVLFLIAFARVNAQTCKDNVQPILVYTATYPSIAVAANASGKVVILVTINSTGNVISTKVVDGIPLLGAAAEQSARKWIFNPISGSNERKIALNFNFVLVRSGAPSEDLISFIRFPDEIEIRHLEPNVKDVSDARRTFQIDKSETHDGFRFCDLHGDCSMSEW